MPYCAKCGVEVDNGVDNCPLCRFPVPNIDNYEKNNRFPDPENSYPLKILAKKKRWLSVITTLFIIVAGLTIFIDYKANDMLTWSRIVAITLSACWIYIFIIFDFIHSYIINLLIFSLNTLGLTFALDYIGDKGLSWFITLAMPLVLMFTALSILFAFLFNKTKKRGINVVSFILLPASLYCIGTEAFISMHVLGIVRLYWSIIVLITALPISFLLLYIHYGISEKYWVKLKRKFHF